MTWAGEERRESGGDLQRALGRIEGKLDAVAEDVKSVTAYAAKNAERIGSLERSRAWLAGAAAAVGAFVSWIIDHFSRGA